MLAHQFWKHFGFEADAMGKPQRLDRPRCHVCHQEVGTKDGNTSNLYSHLKNKHPELCADVCKTKPKVKRPASQRLSSNTFHNVQPHSMSFPEHIQLTSIVTYCLAKDMLPISMIDQTWFRAMLKQFHPR